MVACDTLVVRVIDDSGTLGDRLSSLLQPFDVVIDPVVATAKDAEARVPDIVCIDRRNVSSPFGEIRSWRRRAPRAQIVMLNAWDDGDALRALHNGADEALTWESPALDSRLRALARRASLLVGTSRRVIGDVVFDRETRRVWCSGSEVRMSPRESAVFECLFTRSPGAVGITTLTDFVWNGSASRDVVEVYVGYVRRKLASSTRIVLRTIRGRGYQFALAPDDSSQSEKL
jgi:DNA-binding response OmpR family regulator